MRSRPQTYKAPIKAAPTNTTALVTTEAYKDLTTATSTYIASPVTLPRRSVPRNGEEVV